MTRAFRVCLFFILLLSAIRLSFYAVGNLSESRECINLYQELHQKSMLTGKAKKAGDTAGAKRLASQFRHWSDTTFKPEKQRLDCDRKGEIASDIQRMSILPILIVSCFSSWCLSGYLIKNQKKQ